jgi:hypothetical protein
MDYRQWITEQWIYLLLWKDAGAITAVIEQHTVWKINKKATRKTLWWVVSTSCCTHDKPYTYIRNFFNLWIFICLLSDEMYMISTRLIKMFQSWNSGQQVPYSSKVQTVVYEECCAIWFTCAEKLEGAGGFNWKPLHQTETCTLLTWKKCIFFPLIRQRMHGIMEHIGGYADHYSNMNNCTTCKQKNGFTPTLYIIVKTVQIITMRWNHCNMTNGCI